MRFPEVLKQPSTFVAAALVTACLLALGAAIGGYMVISGATQSVVSLPQVQAVKTASTQG